MSRSYRSRKEFVIAERGIHRCRDGRIVLPRVIERPPAPGDTHPIPKRMLRGVLRSAPIEYISCPICPEIPWYPVTTCCTNVYGR